MERIKRCLNCGSNNVASRLFCEKCGADISRVPVEFLDNEADESAPIISEPIAIDLPNAPNANNMWNEQNLQEHIPAATNLNYVKICRNCGKVSLCNASTCSGCDTELIDIIDTEGKIPADRLTLLEKDDQSEYSMTIVCETEQLRTVRLSNGLSVFGRILLEDREDTLKCYPYISEIHCLISISDGVAEITDVSLNGTYLNDKRIASQAAISDNTSVDICGKECISLQFRSEKE